MTKGDEDDPITRRVAGTGLIRGSRCRSAATRRRSRVQEVGRSRRRPRRAAAGHKPKFAFVTNNSAGFWNIAVKGIQKAEQDFGIKAEVLPPAQGRARRAAALSRRRDGAWASRAWRSARSIPDSMTPLLEQGRREDAGHLPRLGRAQVEAHRVRRHQQRRGGARRGRRGAEGAGRQAQGQGRDVRRPHRHAERDRAPRRASRRCSRRRASRSCPCSWTAPTAPRRRRTSRTRWRVIPTWC